MADKKETPETVRAAITNRAPGDRVVHEHKGFTADNTPITKGRTIRPNESVVIDMTRAEFNSAAGLDGMDLREATADDEADASGEGDGEAVTERKTERRAAATRAKAKSK